MPVTTQSLGIHQSDLVIRSALIRGLQSMRAKPWLLDYCFASLPKDDATAALYGQKTVDQAKEWFTQQEIPVFLNTRIEGAKYPAISIGLSASAEDDATIGDVHYEPSEDSDLQWPTLYGPFTAQAYDHVTGYLTLPLNVSDSTTLGPGMIIIDDVGDMHQVIEVIEDNIVNIGPGVTNSMQKAQVKAQPPAFSAAMESVLCRETYQIGVHVGGEPERLIWLHSIVVFILFAYKESLLEARNLERTSISSTDMGQNPNLSSETELVYSRYITLTGYVRQMWPKSIKQKITALTAPLTASQIATVDPVVDITSTPTTTVASSSGVTPNEPTVYWGNKAVAAYNAGFITTLPVQSVESTRQRLLSFNVGVGEYAYYAFPSYFGGSPSNFIDEETGLEAGFSKVATVTINGILYDLWRSNQPDLGVYEVEVQ